MKKEKLKIELISTIKYYAIDLKGKSYTIINSYDENTNYEGTEIIDVENEEISQEIQNKIMKVFSERVE